MEPLKYFTGKLSREQWILIAIAAAGLLLRIGYLLEFAGLPHFDFAIGADVEEYHGRAQEILHGRFLPEHPEIHAPLYSWFLALLYWLTDSQVAWVRALQVALNFAAYAGLTALLRRQQAPFKVQAGFFAGAMLVPVLVFHQAELISETLFAPLICAFMWLMELGKSRRRCVAGAGVILGGLILTHGLMLFFAAAEVGFALLRKRWQAAALLTAGIMAAVVPVVVIKSVHYGKITGIQDNSGYNLWIGHNPDATGGCYLRPGKMWREPLNLVKRQAAAREISENRIFVEKIGGFYRNDPVQLVILPVKKLLLLLSPGEPVAGADCEALIRMTKVQFYGSGMFAVVIVLALCGTYWAWRDREKRYEHYYLLLIAGTAAALLTVVSGRYRQGMIPGILLLAALGAAKLDRKALYLAVAVFFAGTLLIVRNITGGGEAASVLGEAEYRRGNIFAAKQYLLTAEQELDDPARYDNMLGAIAEKEGDLNEAQRRYRNALTAEPDYAAAWLNLGHLLFRQPGKRQEAVALLEQGVKLDPAGHSGYNLLGVAAAECKNFALAEKYFTLAVKKAPGNSDYENNLVRCRQLARAIKKELKK
ncbi:MAG: tetratricopeptide repeat protein [Lentisphaeria bacterium]|nr:tetratricopeptide repeat protein [Lentisphaeria bacterium]